MTKLAFVFVGLPGSGKTFCAKRLYDAFDSEDERVAWFEDPGSSRKTFDAMNTCMQISEGIMIIDDALLCHSVSADSLRKSLDDNGYKSIWIYFENNAKACTSNDMHRVGSVSRHLKSVALIEKLSKIYDPGKQAVSVVDASAVSNAK